MTGRDLITYILDNRLEDEPINDLKAFLKAMTKEEAALALNSGKTTAEVYVEQGTIDGFFIGSGIYVLPTKKFKGVVMKRRLNSSYQGLGLGVNVRK